MTKETLLGIQEGRLMLVRCRSHRARERLRKTLGELPKHIWSLYVSSGYGAYAVPVDTVLPKGVQRWHYRGFDKLHEGSPLGY